MLMEYEDNGSWACSSLSITWYNRNRWRCHGLYQHTGGRWPLADILSPASFCLPTPGMNHVNVVPSSVKISYDYSRDVKRRTISIVSVVCANLYIKGPRERKGENLKFRDLLPTPAIAETRVRSTTYFIAPLILFFLLLSYMLAISSSRAKIFPRTLMRCKYACCP